MAFGIWQVSRHEITVGVLTAPVMPLPVRVA